MVGWGEWSERWGQWSQWQKTKCMPSIDSQAAEKVEERTGEAAEPKRPIAIPKAASARGTTHRLLQSILPRTRRYGQR